jgi:hypothetical protein
MYYNLNCTPIGMYISDFLTILPMMFQKYSKLGLASSTPPSPPFYDYNIHSSETFLRFNAYV